MKINRKKLLFTLVALGIPALALLLAIPNFLKFHAKSTSPRSHTLSYDLIFPRFSKSFAESPAACRGDECMPCRGGYKGERSVPLIRPRPLLRSMI